jgi:hypothetical protein
MAAPMAAPITLPMPPTITTTSEASNNRVSSPGTIESSTAPMTPPRPARPAPIAKVVANTRFTLTPAAASIARSSTPARIIMPTRVRLRKSHSATPITMPIGRSERR